MDQLLQILGAVLVLAAYAAAQLRLLDARSFAYGLVNLAGSAILAVLALDGRQWGFLLLEGAWALISLWAVVAHLRRSWALSGTSRDADASEVSSGSSSLAGRSSRGGSGVAGTT